MEQNKEKKLTEHFSTLYSQTFFHGTKAELTIGDFIKVGFNSNFGQRRNAGYVFLTSTLDAAICGSELAVGEGRGRIYLVEPTGLIEDDPDLIDRKFPGHLTMSSRSVIL